MSVDSFMINSADVLDPLSYLTRSLSLLPSRAKL